MIFSRSHTWGGLRSWRLCQYRLTSGTGTPIGGR